MKQLGGPGEVLVGQGRLVLQGSLRHLDLPVVRIVVHNGL